MGLLLPTLRGLLHTFYRRVETEGVELVPPTGPVLFALNHPNSLLDPVVLLTSAPRPVSILAAEPLFRKPILGRLVRSVGAIPVYRREDAADRTRNRSTFEAARAHLAQGGAIAIFPEGVSHDAPSLRPLRTGAARIALGATRAAQVTIVPAGLFYTARHRFQSDVLLCFGKPLAVTPSAGPDGEPAAEDVTALTAEIEAALSRVIVQADEHKALRLVRAAERIFSSAEGAEVDLPTLRRRHQRFVAGYERLTREAPGTLRQLEARVRRYHAWLRATGIDLEQLPPRGFTPAQVAKLTVGAIISMGLLLPVAAAGIVVHYPAWWLTRRLAHRLQARMRRGEDVVGTFKLLIGLGLYLATWGFMFLVTWRLYGLRPAAIVTTAAPFLGLASLRFTTRFSRFVATLRAALLALFGGRVYRRLLAERLRLRDEFERLSPPQGPGGGSRSAPDSR